MPSEKKFLEMTKKMKTIINIMFSLNVFPWLIESRVRLEVASN